jgi:hypothetical protein
MLKAQNLRAEKLSEKISTLEKRLVSLTVELAQASVKLEDLPGFILTDTTGISGGIKSISGNNEKTITDLIAPSLPGDAAPKDYVDNFISTAGITLVRQQDDLGVDTGTQIDIQPGNYLFLNSFAWTKPLVMASAGDYIFWTMNELLEFEYAGGIFSYAISIPTASNVIFKNLRLDSGLTGPYAGIIFGDNSDTVIETINCIFSGVASPYITGTAKTVNIKNTKFSPVGTNSINLLCNNFGQVFIDNSTLTSETGSNALNVTTNFAEIKINNCKIENGLDDAFTLAGSWAGNFSLTNCVVSDHTKIFNPVGVNGHSPQVQMQANVGLQDTIASCYAYDNDFLTPTEQQIAVQSTVYQILGRIMTLDADSSRFTLTNIEQTPGDPATTVVEITYIGKIAKRYFIKTKALLDKLGSSAGLISVGVMLNATPIPQSFQPLNEQAPFYNDSLIEIILSENDVLTFGIKNDTNNTNKNVDLAGLTCSIWESGSY